MQPRIGFIGLGIMGEPMAGHILRKGYDLTVHNRTVSKAASLVESGAREAVSPAEVASQTDIIITMVSDTPDVEAVVAGPSGIIQGIRPGSVVVDMSTIAPAMEKKLDEQLQTVGCTLVDAPVSGGDIGAQKGTLAIMAGGRRTDFERVKPVFEAMGSTITHCGPVGHGQLTKLSNQILVSLTLLGVCEAVLFAEKNGLQPEVMIEAVRGGAAASWQLSNLGPMIARADYAPGFMVDLLQKDLGLVLEAGYQARVSLMGTSLVRQLMSAAQSMGDGREGTQVLARVLKTLAAPRAGLTD